MISVNYFTFNFVEFFKFTLISFLKKLTLKKNNALIPTLCVADNFEINSNNLINYDYNAYSFFIDSNQIFSFFSIGEFFLIVVLSYIFIIAVFNHTKKNYLFLSTIISKKLLISIIFLICIYFEYLKVFLNRSFYEKFVMNSITHLMTADFFGYAFKELFLIILFFCVTTGLIYIKKHFILPFEYFIILLCGVLGIFCIISAGNFLMFFLAVETQALSFYVLASLKKNSNASAEAGLKYFILGAISSGILLLSIIIFYNVFGTFSFIDLSNFLKSFPIQQESDFISYFININHFGNLKSSTEFIQMLQTMLTREFLLYISFSDKLSGDTSVILEFDNVVDDVFTSIAQKENITDVEKNDLSYTEIPFIDEFLNSLEHLHSLETYSADILDDVTFFLYNNKFTHDYLFFYKGALFLLCISLFFKLSAAPFHIWAPDVYEGAPLPTTQIFATLSKFIIFMVFIKFSNFFNFISYDLLTISNLFKFVILSCLLVGTFSALMEQRIKKFLTYSSITHLSYLLFAFSNTYIYAQGAGLSYLFLYLLLNCLTWLALLNYKKNNYLLTYLTDFKMISYKNYPLSLHLFLIICSMAGFPPLAFFVYKLKIFISVTHLFSEIQTSWNILIFLAMVLGTVISAYYYLNIIKLIFFERQYKIKLQHRIELENISALCFASITAVLILFSFFPQFLYDIALLLLYSLT